MVKIYFSFIKSYNYSDEDLVKFDTERINYIETIKDAKRRAHSFYVWQLLLYAIKKDMPDFNDKFICQNGKWVCLNNSIQFSLAHSNGVVCVALAKDAVGVDVEMISDKVYSLKKIFPLINDADELTVKWTEKESLFKKGKGNKFFTKKIFDLNQNSYFITTCTDEECVEFEFVDL